MPHLRITQKLQFLPSFILGAAYGDLNGDGINDIVAGSFWWGGPNYKVKHQIRELDGSKKHTPLENGAYKPIKYSNSFVNYVRDINKDGHNDIILIGLPSEPMFAYLNPGKKGGQWQEVALWDVVDNECPQLLILMAMAQKNSFVIMKDIAVTLK